MKQTSRRSQIFLGSRRAPLVNRLMAKGIDLVIIVAIYFLGKAIWFPLGLVAAMAFCAIQDGMGVGQSLGKRITGLRVIEDQRGYACSWGLSVLRNIPFLLAIPFAAMPIFWIFLVALAIPFVVLEVYLIASLTSGIRLGDVLANTLVVEHLEENLEPLHS